MDRRLVILIFMRICSGLLDVALATTAHNTINGTTSVGFPTKTINTTLLNTQASLNSVTSETRNITLLNTQTNTFIQASLSSVSSAAPVLKATLTSSTFQISASRSGKVDAPTNLPSTYSGLSTNNLSETQTSVQNIQSSPSPAEITSATLSKTQTAGSMSLGFSNSKLLETHTSVQITQPSVSQDITSSALSKTRTAVSETQAPGSMSSISLEIASAALSETQTAVSETQAPGPMSPASLGPSSNFNITPSSTSKPVHVTSTATNGKPAEPKPLIIKYSILVNSPFSLDLNDRESLAYLRMQSKVQNTISAAYKNNTSEYLFASIGGFESKNEKIQCNGRLYFNSTSGSVTRPKSVLENYLKKLPNGWRVTSFVKTDKLEEPKDDDDDVIFGLNWWQIGVIIAGVVILILFVAVFCLCSKIQKIKKNHKKENLMYGNQLFGFDGGNDEMKTLRASQSNLAGKIVKSDATAQHVNTDFNYNTTDNTLWSPSSPTGDGLVMQTNGKIEANNEKNDSATTSADVLDL